MEPELGFEQSALIPYGTGGRSRQQGISMKQAMLALENQGYKISKAPPDDVRISIMDEPRRLAIEDKPRKRAREDDDIDHLPEGAGDDDGAGDHEDDTDDDQGGTRDGGKKNNILDVTKRLVAQAQGRTPKKKGAPKVAKDTPPKTKGAKATASPKDTPPKKKGAKATASTPTCSKHHGNGRPSYSVERSRSQVLGRTVHLHRFKAISIALRRYPSPNLKREKIKLVKLRF